MLARVLALDLGKKRIGLAISDPLGITAQGLPTHERSVIREDIGAIDRQARELDAGAILLGLPRTLKGEESKQAEWVREFGARLEKRCSLPVLYWDERFTSVEAERVLKQSGGDRLSRKGKVDRLAAVILLQSFLDAGAPGVGGDHADSDLWETGEEPGDLV